MTKLILLDSLLQEDRVLAPQGPVFISAVAELVQYICIFVKNLMYNSDNKFCYCRNRRRALWRKHSILLEKWIKQYKLGRIRQVAILNSPVVTSWRTESSNISLVVLDKLLYYSRNLVFFIFQNFLKTNRPTDRPTDRHRHVYRRLPSSKNVHLVEFQCINVHGSH